MVAIAVGVNSLAFVGTQWLASKTFAFSSFSEFVVASDSGSPGMLSFLA